LAFWDKKIAAINPGHSNNQDDSRHHLARKPSYLAASIQFRVCPIYDLRQRSELTMLLCMVPVKPNSSNFVQRYCYHIVENTIQTVKYNKAGCMYSATILVAHACISDY